MNYRMDEVAFYDAYSDEPDAENSVRYAGEAVPVYVHETPGGARVLTTSPDGPARLFGYLHVYEDADPELDHRIIVVKGAPRARPHRSPA